MSDGSDGGAPAVPIVADTELEVWLDWASVDIEGYKDVDWLLDWDSFKERAKAFSKSSSPPVETAALELLSEVTPEPFELMPK